MVNIVNDERSRNLVKSFLEVAARSYIGMYDMLNGEGRLPPKSEFFICGGACFAKSVELDKAIDLICARCHDRAEASHDDDVIECLWLAVADVLPQGGIGSLVRHVKVLFERLEGVVRGERLYINDNHVIHLHSGPISIGPVRAIKSSSLTDISSAAEITFGLNITRGRGDSFSSLTQSRTIRRDINPICGPASPIPGASYMVSSMSSATLRSSSVTSVTGSTTFFRRGSGWIRMGLFMRFM